MMKARAAILIVVISAVFALSGCTGQGLYTGPLPFPDADPPSQQATPAQFDPDAAREAIEDGFKSAARQVIDAIPATLGTAAALGASAAGAPPLSPGAGAAGYVFGESLRDWLLGIFGLSTVGAAAKAMGETKKRGQAESRAAKAEATIEATPSRA